MMLDKDPVVAANEAMEWQTGLAGIDGGAGLGAAFDWNTLAGSWTKIAGDILTYRNIQPGTTLTRNGETISVQNPGYPVLQGNLGLSTSMSSFGNIPGGMLTLGLGAVALVLVLGRR